MDGCTRVRCIVGIEYQFTDLPRCYPAAVGLPAECLYRWVGSLHPHHVHPLRHHWPHYTSGGRWRALRQIGRHMTKENNPVVLDAKGITKKFPGVLANDNVNLDL